MTEVLSGLKLPTRSDVEFFEANGYWIGPVAVDRPRLDAALAAMDRVYAGEYRTGVAPRLPRVATDTTTLRQCLNSWWADPDLAAVAHDSYIAACAAKLLGVDVIKQWEDQLLWKPGGGAATGSIGWHQDWHYWGGSASVDELCTAWIAFDDTGEANGAMRFVPGSHRWGLLAESDFHGKDLASQREAIEARGLRWREVPVILKAGQFSIHHCNLLHGSGPNATPAPRRSMAVHMLSGNVKAVRRAGHPVPQHQNWELLERLGKGEGDSWDGVYWPVLYPAQGPIQGPPAHDR